MINILNLSATLVKFSNGIEIQNAKQQHIKIKDFSQNISLNDHDRQIKPKTTIFLFIKYSLFII
jgi:hypothetical protein